MSVDSSLVNFGTKYEPREQQKTFAPTILGRTTVGTFTLTASTTAQPLNPVGYWTQHVLNGASIVDFHIRIEGTLAGAAGDVVLTTNLPAPKWVDVTFADVEVTGLTYANVIRARLLSKLNVAGTTEYQSAITLENVAPNGVTTSVAITNGAIVLHMHGTYIAVAG